MTRIAIPFGLLIGVLTLGLIATMAQASETQWAVSLRLDGPVVGMSDPSTYLGVKPSATDDNDVGIDVSNPPPSPGTDYVDLYFHRPTWPGQSDWAQDWRSPLLWGKTDEEWLDLRATGTLAGDYTLSWTLGAGSPEWEPPAYYSFTLYDEGESPDPTGGTAHDMLAEVSFNYSRIGAVRYFHITVNDTRSPTTLTMSQPQYEYTYGETSHVAAQLLSGMSMIGCLSGVRFEWDLDGDGEYDDLTADGVDNDCDGTYEADVLLDVCAGTYSVRASFLGDDNYQPSVSPPSVHENHKGWIEILGGESLPIEEVPFTYTDPGSVIITAQDGFGNLLLNPENLPEVRMEIYAYGGGGYGVTKVFDKASPKLATACSGPCRTETTIDLEIQEGGEVDLMPGEYYAVFSWPGDCHYRAAITEAALIVEPETLALADCGEGSHLSIEADYCEPASSCSHALDDDGEELYHSTDYPVQSTLSVWHPETLTWEPVGGGTLPAGLCVCRDLVAEQYWHMEEVTLAGGNMGFRLDYSGSPYYAAAEEQGSLLLKSTDKASPILYGGWNMISVPGYAVDPDPATVFAGIPIDGTLYRWDPELKSYVAYLVADSGPFGEVAPGEGYWLYLDQPSPYLYQAYCMSSIEIAMPTTGWYLIGNPGVAGGESLPMEEVSFNYGGQTLPFAQAVAAGWVSSPLYMWDPSLGGYVTIGLDPWDLPYLPAFAGAWAQINAVDCYLFIE